MATFHRKHPIMGHPVMQHLAGQAVNPFMAGGIPASPPPGAPAPYGAPQANPFMGGVGGPAGMVDPNAQANQLMAHPVMQSLMQGAMANPFQPAGGPVGLVDPNAPPLTGKATPIGRKI